MYVVRVVYQGPWLSLLSPRRNGGLINAIDSTSITNDHNPRSEIREYRKFNFSLPNGGELFGCCIIWRPSLPQPAAKGAARIGVISYLDPDLDEIVDPAYCTSFLWVA
jgi:hypothetical protein